VSFPEELSQTASYPGWPSIVTEPSSLHFAFRAAGISLRQLRVKGLIGLGRQRAGRIGDGADLIGFGVVGLKTKCAARRHCPSRPATRKWHCPETSPRTRPPGRGPSATCRRRGPRRSGDQKRECGRGKAAGHAYHGYLLVRCASSTVAGCNRCLPASQRRAQSVTGSSNLNESRKRRALALVSCPLGPADTIM